MLRITLYQLERDDIRVDIQAYFSGEDLIVEGYDIGKTVEKYWGDSDYEYSTTIGKEEVEKIFPLLDIAGGDREGLLKAIAGRFNTNSCYSEFRDFLEKNGVHCESFSWV